eukprot:Transcript_17784.p1 GENE.Transcript_17784~~Transcript_17784.p1  ORF type:complete len:417 (-),score=177.69 Transcript_17784:729-1979(-)
MLLLGSLFLLGASTEEEPSSSTSEPPGSWLYYCYSGADTFSAASPNFDFRSLPQPSSAFAAASQPQKGAVESDGGAAAAEQDSGAARLRSMQGTCFYMRVGYWTYEVCPFKRVRQYHSETSAKDGTKVHSEFSIGQYDASQDDWRPTQLLYLQQFTNGQEGRTATVRIICPENRREEDGIVIVHEPRVKQYVITLRVAAVCTPAAPGKKKAAATPEAALEKAAAAGAAVAAEKAAAAAATPAPAAARGAPLAELATPQARLLAPIRGRCFQITKDYWTYEYCPMKHVRQFHVESHRITSEFSLGKYDETADARLALPTGAVLPSGLVPHVFAASYVNGTGNRATNVRVRCAAKNEHTLLAIEEPSMHKYQLEFSTPLACELNCAYTFHPAETEDEAQTEGQAAAQAAAVVEEDLGS